MLQPPPGTGTTFSNPTTATRRWCLSRSTRCCSTTVGLRHYWPYQLILALLDVGCGWLLFVVLRRKIQPLSWPAQGALH